MNAKRDQKRAEQRLAKAAALLKALEQKSPVPSELPEIEEYDDGDKETEFDQASKTDSLMKNRCQHPCFPIHHNAGTLV